uniref:type II secretion system protein n=1 Tax=Acetatifactor sp. TaxID=1872090 RepID=UPI004056D099
MKKDNKGFSLVELIVVVAIMAVLMTVLAPQLLRYVEQSRVQKDKSAIAEIENAIEIAMSFEGINNAVVNAGGATVTIPGGATTNMAFTDASGVVSVEELADELELSIGSVTLSSNTYSNQTFTISVAVASNGVVTVSHTVAATAAPTP